MSFLHALNRTMQWVLCAVVLLLATPVRAACDHPLKIGWEPWPPYQYVNSDGILTGLDIEIANAVAKAAGCEVEFYEIPWKRHLQELERGKIDIALGASWNQQRSTYAWFSEPYRQEVMSLFINRKDSSRFPYHNLEDLIGQPFRLGATLGYVYGDQFAQLTQNPQFKKQLEYVYTDQLNYVKLLRGRIDGLLADPVTAGQQLDALHEPHDIVELFKLYANDIHFMFSKVSVSEDTVNAFNSALERLKSEGTYYEILHHYLP